MVPSIFLDNQLHRRALVVTVWTQATWGRQIEVSGIEVSGVALDLVEVVDGSHGNGRDPIGVLSIATTANATVAEFSRGKFPLGRGS